MFLTPTKVLLNSKHAREGQKITSHHVTRLLVKFNCAVKVLSRRERVHARTSSLFFRSRQAKIEIAIQF